MDKHGSYDDLYSFFFHFRIFCLKMVWNGHFGTVDWWIAWKPNSEPFWTISDRVGGTVLVGLKIDPWRRDGTVPWNINDEKFFEN